MDHLARFLDLQRLLAEHQALWRPAPFHVRQPGWCERWPALAAELQRLDEDRVEAFASDPEAARAWLGRHLPVLDTLAERCGFPALETRPLPPAGPHFGYSIPGRKLAQIETFAEHCPPSRGPLLEWCAGKGHLGRRLALVDSVPVRSLEIDPGLCAEGARLAARSGVDQEALCGDALEARAQGHVRGREVVALHACGELHRVLVRGAAAGGARGYRIAPCCYHLGVDGDYRPLGRSAALALDAGSLRLAVTETVTAPPRQRRQLAREQAWKLAFVALREALEGEGSRTFRAVPAGWLAADFPAFCRALAAREGLRLPERIDWAHWLTVGTERRAAMRRFELVRHGFRRALESWLVLDLALGLEEAGFEVRLGSFCARAVSPRNLLLLAHRAGG